MTEYDGLTTAQMQSACSALYGLARSHLADGNHKLALSYQAVAKRCHQQLQAAIGNSDAYLW
jgi:hypothetical protein